MTLAEKGVHFNVKLAAETEAQSTNDANSPVPASQRHEHNEADNRGGGKSWDQAVNSKVRGGSFAEYAAAALQRLDLAEYQPLPQAELAGYEERHAHRRQEIAVFWTIRAVLAPLIEGLLLLDRTLYLHEECQCGACKTHPSRGSHTLSAVRKLTVSCVFLFVGLSQRARRCSRCSTRRSRRDRS